MLSSEVVPLRIKTADGSFMDGGRKGCMCSLVIPTFTHEGVHKMVECAPYWGYEASITDCDIILGYPFLKGFRFIINCQGDYLQAQTPTPISTRSLNVTIDMHGAAKDRLVKVQGGTSNSQLDLPG